MKQTVYTASPESQQIHVWSLDLEGNLKLVQVVDAPGQVQPMVVSPNKEYLYVGVRPEFRVLAYRIAPDNGALTFAGEAALPGSPLWKGWKGVTRPIFRPTTAPCGSRR